MLLSAAFGLKSVRHSHVLGVSVVGFEHRDSFLICQRGVWAAEENYRLDDNVKRKEPKQIGLNEVIALIMSIIFSNFLLKKSFCYSADV